MKEQICVIVISYWMNLFVKPVLDLVQSLGYDALLLHSHKTPDQVKKLRTPSSFIVDTRYAGFNALHSEILDDILIKKKFEETLKDYEVLLFVDHDFWMDEESFLAMAQFMIHTVMCGKSLAARSGPGIEINKVMRYFYTHPMMAVSNKCQWPEKWHYVRYQGKFQDTGQLLYEKMISEGRENEIALIPETEIQFNEDYHWSSAWDWIQHHKDASRRQFFNNHYTKLMQTNIWKPGPEDHEKLFKHPVLGPIARNHMV